MYSQKVAFETELSADIRDSSHKLMANPSVLGLLALGVVMGLAPMSQMAEVLGGSQLSEQNEGQEVGEEESRLY